MLKKQPTAILMVGIAGVGKSSWVEAHADELAGFQVISSDAIVDEIAAREGTSYQDAFLQHSDAAYAQVDAEIAEASATGQSFVNDNTNITRQKREEKLSGLGEEWLRIGVNFHFDRSRLDKRLKTRQEETGKEVPGFVIDRMVGQYEPPGDEFDAVVHVGMDGQTLYTETFTHRGQIFAKQAKMAQTTVPEALQEEPCRAEGRF